MKIVMLGHKRIPSREGGVEIVVEELAVRMVALGHNVTVYNRKGHHVSGAENELTAYQKKYDYKGVHVETVPTSQKKSLNALVYSFLATLRACFTHTDIIHFHAEGPCAMLPIAKLFHKNCVATIHGLDWQRAKWGGFATKFLLFGEKMAAKHADVLIVLSKGVQQYFLDTYQRETVLIPNGIEEKEMVPAEIIYKKYGLQENSYLLFLARLVPEKGAHTLLAAYEKCNIKLPLVIAGGSSHSDEYQQQIKKMAEKINLSEHTSGKQVILTGFVQGKELEELYSNCMLYILPSEIEGMPLSLLEAMSYGKLCLTSDIQENTDVTDGHGICFINKNVDSLTAVVNDVIMRQRELRAKEEYCSNTIKASVSERFNWNQIVKRTLQCYESINCK